MDPHTADGKPDASSAKPIVVIIDDDPLFVSSISLLLRSKYRIRAFASGPEALPSIDEDVAVVLLDVKLVEDNGFRVYDDIRKLDAFVPIIFHSAYQDIKHPFDIINRYRPFAYLQKGADLSVLWETLAEAAATFEMNTALRGLARARDAREAQEKA